MTREAADTVNIENIGRPNTKLPRAASSILITVYGYVCWTQHILGVGGGFYLSPSKNS